MTNRHIVLAKRPSGMVDKARDKGEEVITQVRQRAG